MDRRTNKFRSDYDDSGGGGKTDRHSTSSYRHDENYYDSHYGNKYGDNDDNGYNGEQQRRRDRRSRSPRSPPRSTNGSSKSNRSRYDDSYDSNNRNSSSNYYNNQQQSYNNRVVEQQPQLPTRTILIRQVPTQMSDDELTRELSSTGMCYKQVRLVKSRETGLNRGFAFVEFNTIDEAKYWIDSTRGVLKFPNYNNVRVQICFSHSNEDPFKSNESSEWNCAKCGVNNFKKREKCFKCGLSREESERRLGGEAYDYCGTTPCNTIVLKGLDALTTNETIIGALNQLSNYSIYVKKCHIARDSLTNVSSGFAFVEFGSIQESSSFLSLIPPNFELDGKQISFSYSKNNFQTAISQLESNSRTTYEKFGTESTSTKPMPSQHYYTKKSTNENTSSQVNSAAAVAQAAIQSMAKKQEFLSHYTSSLKQSSGSCSGTSGEPAAASAKLAAPDPSQFTYDESSGFYYDYSTGLYYDPNTHYYYNSMTQQYLYWDAASFNYLPVMSTTAATAAAPPTTDQQQQQTDQDKMNQEAKAKSKPPVKNASQIAKEMEKWAQSVNKKKEAVATTTMKKPSSSSSTTVVHTAAVAKTVESTFTPIRSSFVDVNQSNSQTSTQTASATIAAAAALATSTAAAELTKKQTQPSLNEKRNSEFRKSPLSPSQPQQTKINESALIDETKLSCLLCKRKFDSLDILHKHVAKSDLHKKNLEALKQQKQQQPGSLEKALQYQQERKRHDNSSDEDSNIPVAKKSLI